VSEPRAAWHNPAATATAEPPLLPPATLQSELLEDVLGEEEELLEDALKEEEEVGLCLATSWPVVGSSRE